MNVNVVHQCRAASEGASIMHTQLFSRELLTGTGLIARKYIAPLENCVPMEFQVLRAEDPEQRAMLLQLEDIFSVAEADYYGYEIEVNAGLMHLWKMLLRLAEPKMKIENPPAREDSARTKQMLSFIHEHYPEPIAVRHIAAAAGICERECYRCFEKVLDTSPQSYLTRHRINTAARMLAETNMTVAQIASDCGFSDASYFGKVFRSTMGCSPRDFRKDK